MDLVVLRNISRTEEMRAWNPPQLMNKESGRERESAVGFDVGSDEAENGCKSWLSVTASVGGATPPTSHRLVWCRDALDKVWRKQLTTAPYWFFIYSCFFENIILFLTKSDMLHWTYFKYYPLPPQRQAWRVWPELLQTETVKPNKRENTIWKQSMFSPALTRCSESIIDTQ